MFGLDRTALVGMVHLEALPGAPGWKGSLDEVLEAARRDARTLRKGGCDALLVENMGDLPWLKGRVPPWTTAAMTLAVQAVLEEGLPVGVQVLAGANEHSLGIAVATGASFVRVEGFAYGHVADEGWIEACAGQLLRARAMLGSDVEVWADVQKKHAAHAVTGDISLEDLACGHAFNGADAVIVTGGTTGEPPTRDDVLSMRRSGVPVVVGSGVSPHTAPALGDADAWIVGSWLKEGGDWRRPVDIQRVRTLLTFATLSGR
jgi:membrane complex biogenesis BtpA family protein